MSYNRDYMREYQCKRRAKIRAEKIAGGWIDGRTKQGRAAAGKPAGLSPQQSIKKYNGNPANRQKMRARWLYQKAIERGHLPPPLDYCEECGATGVSITAHHPDYGKPLEVVYLCRRCHGARHSDRVEEK